MIDTGMFTGGIRHVVLKKIKTYDAEQCAAMSDKKLMEAAKDALRALQYLKIMDMNIPDDDDPERFIKYGEKVQATVTRLRPVLAENARRFEARHQEVEPFGIPKWPAEGIPAPLEDLLLQEADQELEVARHEWSGKMADAQAAVGAANEQLKDRRTRYLGKVRLEEALVNLDELKLEMDEALLPLRERARAEKIRAIGERIDLTLPAIAQLRDITFDLTEQLLRARNDYWDLRAQAEAVTSGMNVSVPGDDYVNRLDVIMRALKNPIKSRVAQALKTYGDMR